MRSRFDDDRAAWLSTARPLQVAVVGGPSQLPALLTKDKSLRVVEIDPAAYPQTKADLWIFDRWLPAVAPGGPALAIDPPASTWLGPVRAGEDRPVWRSGAPHPVLAGVDTTLVHFEQAHSVGRESLVPIAVSERNTPLVSVEDSASGRHVVLGFAVDADFAATPAFPVLIANAIDWLARPERDREREPGPVVLAATTQRVIAPTGTPLPLRRSDDRVTTVLPGPGLFLVESAGAQSVLVAKLGDSSRSNLLASTINGDSSQASRPPLSGRPWWVYATWAALGLVALEWVTWRRRVTV